MYDENGYVVPHCSLCMDEIKLGQELIMMDMYGNYGLIHARCEDLNKCGEVVARNFDIFQSFLEQFNKIGVYNR